MEENLKQLLLKDLCARLPYGVKCHFKYGAAEDDVTLGCIDNGVARFEYGWYGRFHVSIDVDYIKPYLRPMSSMTEEEIKEFSYRVFQQPDLNMVKEWKTLIIDSNQLSKPVDFLNEKMFDWHKIKRDNKYISMIEAGLALEAPEGMYNTKN